jgi:hypothetical protein
MQIILHFCGAFVKRNMQKILQVKSAAAEGGDGSAPGTRGYIVRVNLRRVRKTHRSPP